MLPKRLCRDCNIEHQMNLDRCPHCARPGNFPNVDFAALEQAELQGFYEDSRRDAAGRGAAVEFEDFERRVGADSKAVLARSANELQRLATSDNEVYATFYDLLEANVRLWEASEWSVWRSIADPAFFPGYHKHIRFAALSLEPTGLSNYGECHITLRDAMIAHRASVFVDNTVMFLRRRNIPFNDLTSLPKGFRATWEDRARLCAMKLAEMIQAGLAADAHASLLIKQGPTSDEDEFVEVHVWGPMTARTFERVAVRTRTGRPSRDIIADINLARLEGIDVEIV